MTQIHIQSFNLGKEKGREFGINYALLQDLCNGDHTESGSKLMPFKDHHSQKAPK